VSASSPLISSPVTNLTRGLGTLERNNPPNFEWGSLMSQSNFEAKLRLGLSEVLSERPELRNVLPLAAMMDDALRWCA